MASPERFGYEWHKYNSIDPNYELQFRRWIGPLAESDFRGKKILDAGAGMGRNSYWALQWGASSIVAFDFDERSVAAARRNLAECGRVTVLFKSIYDLNWEDEFDLAFSIGVIHHLDEPQKAIQNIARALKPGGQLLIWVYSKEGNKWLLRFIDPIRRHLTSRLPVPLVHALSYFLSIPLWAFVKIFHGPTPYLAQLSRFRFAHMHSIVFDQLIPRVANYWTREEALELLNIAELQDVRIHRPENLMGWTVIAVKRHKPQIYKM